MITKFIVLSRSRCGSTLLVSYLRSHPNIQCEGEILKASCSNEYSFKLDHHNIFSPKSRNIKCSGIKLFTYHGKNHPKIYEHLLKDKSIKIINLTRDNTLEMYVSKILMGKGPSALKDPNKRDMKSTVTIEPKEYMKWHDDYEKYKTSCKELFKDHSMINITYEELVSDKEENIRKIQKFLGVQYSSLQTPLVKQQVRPMAKVIENYKELKENLKNTKYYSNFG